MDRNNFDAAESPLGGTYIIEASAGTGKTYGIAILVLRLILEKKMPIEKILAVTFTKAATEELKDRIGKFLREALEIYRGKNGDAVIAGIVDKCRKDENCESLIKKAILSLDEAAVFTIHGFCMRILEDNAFEADSSFNAEMIQNQDVLINEIAADFFRTEVCSLPEAVLEYAGDALSVSKLKDFLKTYLRNDLEISCPDVSIEKLLADTEAAEEQAARAKACWERERSEIIGLIAETEFKYPVPNLLSRDLHLLPNRLNGIFKGVFPHKVKELKKDDLLKYLPQTYLNEKAKEGFGIAHEFFRLMEGLSERVEKLFRDIDRLAAGYKGRLYEYAEEALKARKEEKNIRYYDDLLLRLYEALKGAGKDNLARVMRSKYKAVLIDEFQDTDGIQYDIFNTLFDRPDSSLFLIGDPKQSIYGFRGADIFSYMNAKKQIPSSSCFTMATNYRSSDTMVEAFNRLFDIDRPFKYEEIPYHNVKSDKGEAKRLIPAEGETDKPIVIWKRIKNGGKKSAGAAADAHGAVAEEIISLLEGASLAEGSGTKCLEASDIAVLVPSRRRGEELMEVLQSRNIPAVMYGTKSVFTSEEARELLLVLRAAAEPSVMSYINGALLTSLMGYDAQMLAELEDDDRAALSEQFKEYRRLWEKEGFIQMMMKLVSDYNIRQRLMSRAGGARSLTNLLHVSELLHGAASSGSCGIRGLTERLNELITEAAEEAFRGSEEQELRLERDDKAVTVMTIHGSKGLEFPIVFAPYMWREPHGNRIKKDGFIFHDSNKNNKRFLVLGEESEEKEGSERYKAALEENLAEHLRLFYVAVTRARSRCYLLHNVKPEKEKAKWRSGKETDPADAEDYFLGDADKRFGKSEVIGVMPLPAGGGRLEPTPEESGKLEAKVFTGNIQRDWRISSFTRMTSGRQDLGSAADEAPSRSEEVPLFKKSFLSGEPSIFSFKRGADAGNALHEILEKTAFDAEHHRDTVRSVLRRYRLAGGNEEYVPVIEQTIKDTLHAPLPVEPSFCLADVREDSKAAELRFWFPVPHGRSKGDKWTIELWKDEGKSDVSIEAFSGFVNGAVDLLFKHKGKYYIVDWKSNYLGRTEADYGYEAMHGEILKNAYNLQYMLYSLAVDRFLSRTDPAYDFDTGFGGLFYIFLRGVCFGKGMGIYYVSPKDIKRNMEAMRKYFPEGGM